jgi:AraC-like DNA-binding protein
LAHCGFNADNPWLPLAQAEATEARFQALVTAVLAPPADASCAVMAHLGLLLHHLPDYIRHSDAPIAKGLGLLDYRTTDLSGPAAAAGCSVPQFVKRFKRATGHTPWQYVLSRRIDRAKELLAGTAEAVATIAHQVGFDDADYFSRVFRKRVGYAPSVFRSRFSESRLT